MLNPVVQRDKDLELQQMFIAVRMSITDEQGSRILVKTPFIAGEPRISGLRGLYTVGDIVEANCTSPPSKPVAHVTWYMNDKQMDAEWLIDYGIPAEFTARLDSDESTNLHVAIKGIRLPATEITFPNRILKLSCMARLGSQQWEQQCWTFLIHHHVSGLGSANWSREEGQFVAAILVLILNSS
ncbi:uncharacterized protein LOC111861878 isoform X2 [Cryptotermes secundus]|uniref:uncharacterized protein LOC111861878 isoform X2 n=1 Tax=Cryptotermes secundus TaxID=105785 RepID=UPI000CD7D38B|nr:uncharacterized protein LOC111861878 isoform X2 [Cryptotermes secundus]